MATLTGTTIQSTYDSLLKVTDNDSITGSLKRITDGLGNNTPLYLSSSAVEIVSALNVIGNITGTNLSGTNTGDETKASIESKLGAATSSNSGYLTSTDWSTFNNKIAGSGTLNKLAKFSSSSSIADSSITDTGSAVTIGVATTVSGTITSSGFIKTGGSPFEFLKADGTVDTNSYVTFSRTLTINGTTQDLSANRTFNVGTVTSVSGTGTVSGLTLTGTVTSSGSLTLGGSLTLTSGQITSGLGYTPVPTTRTLTINGTSYDLSADRSWTISPSQWITSGSNIYYNTGNVGIGTSSPSSALHVVGSGIFSSGLTVGSLSSGSDAIISLATNASGAPRTIYYKASNATINITGTGGTDLMTITNGGNVGIGTSSPGTLLDVNGTGRFGGLLSTTTGNGLVIGGSSLAFATSSTRGSLHIVGSTDRLLSFGTNGNWDTYIYSSSSLTQINTAPEFAIAVNGSERMRITSGGNVGIGTSSPATRTHFVGGSTTTSAANAATTVTSRFDVANPAISLGIGYVSTDIPMIHGFNNGTNNATNLTINPFGGNVGIGTTSPNAKLHIQNQTSANTSIQIHSFGSEAAGEYAGIFLKSAATNANEYTKGLIAFRNNGTGYGRGDLYLCLNNDLSAANASLSDVKAVITSGGNVGIGTSSPDKKLHVSGSDTVLHIQSGTGGVYMQMNSGVSSSYIGQLGSSMYFENGGSERMRITSGGNVGIGTSSPSRRFTVSISPASGGEDGVFVTDNLSNNMIVGRTGTAYNYIGIPASCGLVYSNTTLAIAADGSPILFSAGGLERMRITSTGNVGIGTTSPGSALDVRGVITGGNGTIQTVISYLSDAGVVGTLSNHHLSLYANFAERMRIFSGGNVAIGSSTDNNTGAKLQVTGGMTYQNLFNRRTASYTLTINDQNYIVEMNVGSANNLTIPPNSSAAFPIGTEIAIIQYGAGQTTIVAGAGVTLRSKSNALKISGRYAGCTCVKVGTDEWYVIGDLTL